MTWPYSICFFSCYVLSIVAYNSDHFSVGTYLSNSLQKLLTATLQEHQFTVIQKNVLSNYRSNNATLNNTIMEKLFEELMQQIPEEIVLPNYKVYDQIPGYNIKLYLCTTSATVTNLSNYIIDNVNIIMSNTNVPISLETRFIFPLFELAGNYELDVNSPDFHIFGVGPFSIFFHDTKFNTRSNFSVTTRNHLNMTDFSTDISLDSSEVRSTKAELTIIVHITKHLSVMLFCISIISALTIYYICIRITGQSELCASS